MWLSLKMEKPHNSWNFLIDAQDYMEASIRAADIHGFERHVYTEKLSLIEKSVFPPQSFMSPVWLVKSSTCTIYRRKYRDCDHISGKAYTGVFCAEEVDRYDILSVASVPEPWDKVAARSLSFKMEWREIL